jgi:hypothetical protein
MSNITKEQPTEVTYTGRAIIDDEARQKISEMLRHLLADVFVLYVKTKNFHWHMTGPHFREYHLLLDEQSEQIFHMTDDIAERARKIALPHSALSARSCGTNAFKIIIGPTWRPRKCLRISPRITCS